MKKTRSAAVLSVAALVFASLGLGAGAAEQAGDASGEPKPSTGELGLSSSQWFTDRDPRGEAGSSAQVELAPPPEPVQEELSHPELERIVQEFPVDLVRLERLTIGGESFIDGALLTKSGDVVVFMIKRVEEPQHQIALQGGDSASVLQRLDGGERLVVTDPRRSGHRLTSVSDDGILTDLTVMTYGARPAISTGSIRLAETLADRLFEDAAAFAP